MKKSTFSKFVVISLGYLIIFQIRECIKDYKDENVKVLQERNIQKELYKVDSSKNEKIPKPKLNLEGENETDSLERIYNRDGLVPERLETLDADQEFYIEYFTP